LYVRAEECRTAGYEGSACSYERGIDAEIAAIEQLQGVPYVIQWEQDGCKRSMTVLGSNRAALELARLEVAGYDPTCGEEAVALYLPYTPLTAAACMEILDEVWARG
jgi:hypothetical protein